MSCLPRDSPPPTCRRNPTDQHIPSSTHHPRGKVILTLVRKLYLAIRSPGRPERAACRHIWVIDEARLQPRRRRHRHEKGTNHQCFAFFPGWVFSGRELSLGTNAPLSVGLYLHRVDGVGSCTVACCNRHTHCTMEMACLASKPDLGRGSVLPPPVTAPGAGSGI